MMIGPLINSGAIVLGCGGMAALSHTTAPVPQRRALVGRATPQLAG